MPMSPVSVRRQRGQRQSGTRRYEDLLKEAHVNLRYIDSIWRVRDSFELEERQSPAEVFDQLDPLFQTKGTSFEIDHDTLTYTKDNPAAQDKMATFTKGTLRVVDDGEQSRLVYTLFSPALLFCFLAPFVFLAFGQFTVFLSEREVAAAQAAGDSREASAEEEEKDEEVKPLHPIDVMLGAPAPEDPNAKKEGDEEEEEEEGDHSPTRSYVLAGLFFTLYLIGRKLEPWLMKSRFRKALAGDLETGDPDTVEAEPGGHSEA